MLPLRVLLPLAGSLVSFATAQDVRGPAAVLPQLPDVKTPAPPVPDTAAKDLAELEARKNASAAPVVSPATPAPAHLARASRTRTEVEYDVTASGQVWARGETYKASFGADGAAYIPYFGSKAPRNYPLHFALREVTVGGEDLDFLRAPVATRTEDVVSLERGLLDEVYWLDLDSVEQTFVLERAAGPGDVVIDLAVTTDLTPGEGAEGFTFGNELGHVHYGLATAVDAEGEQLPLATEWTGDGIRITVPASFAATAAYPLVVDPVLNTFSLDTFGDDLLTPRNCWDDTNQVFVVVYEEVFSGTDHDIYCWSYDNGGSLGGNGYANLTSEDSQSPDVAWSPATGECLVVWSLDDGVLGARQIVGRPYTVGVGYGTQFPISTAAGASGGDKLHPAVGADSIDDFMVVWERVFSAGTDHDVHGAQVDEFTYTVGPTIFIDNSGGTLDQRPDISKTNGFHLIGTSRWMVVWDREQAGVTSIMAAVYSWDGSNIHAPFEIDSSSFTPRSHARVSSPTSGVGEREFAISYQRDYGTDYDAIVAYVQGASLIDTLALNTGTILDDEWNSGIDCNGTHFTCAYGEGDLAGGLVDMKVVTLVPVGGNLFTSDEGILTVSSGGDEQEGDVCFKHTYPTPVGLDVGNAGLAYQSWDGTNWDIHGAVHERYYTVFGTGYCTNQNANSTGEAAKLFVAGDSFAGGILTLYCTDMPANQFGYFLCSQTQGLTANPGGSQGNICLANNIGRYNLLVQNSGAEGGILINTSTTSMPVNPPVAALPGQTWNFQAWYRDQNPGLTSNFSTAISVLFN